MIQFSVGAERMASFKDRAQTATKNGYIEKGVRDTCKLINEHPHLATMWSCEGHGMYSKSPGNLHIVFCSTCPWESNSDAGYVRACKI